jgi:hypothetical protein
MGVMYGRVAVVPVLAKLFDASLYGLFDLGNLTTWKFSLISLDSVHKMSISAHGEIKKDLHIFND